MARTAVALFVEGALVPAPARRQQPLVEIWQSHLCRAAGVEAFSHVEPISKKHLVAMDPDNPPMSGAAEPLDALIERKRAQRGFDAAVVAWDLVPRWNPDGDYCRRKEVLRLYELLAASAHLPQPWRARAAIRRAEVEARRRRGPPVLHPGCVLALCMEPMFEGILCQDDAAARRAVDLPTGVIPKGWPREGWGDATVRQPDAAILSPAVKSLLAHRPKPESVKRIRGDMRTKKNEWGEYILRGLLDDPIERSLITDHAIVQRMREWMP